MKLENKKTGEIGYTAVLRSKAIVVMDENAIQLGSYTSLAELNEEWEDYEEPKEYWYIYADGDIYKDVQDDVRKDNGCKEIGNYFETKEEAEKTVEKLKAWKRLKDTYFVRFDLDFLKNTLSFTYRIDGTLHSAVNEERIVFEDMKTIFGGEE